MNLASHVDNLRHQLAVAADAGSDEARALAERLTASLESAARLVLLEVLSEAADEITRELAPGAVEVRLRGRDPGFVVTPPPAEDVYDNVGNASAGPALIGAVSSVGALTEGDDGPTSRLNLRLSDALKLRIEEAARMEGLSLNTWLIRAAATALEHVTQDRPTPPRGPSGGQRFVGWVR